MKIKYLGHSSFFISSQNSLRLITDPYSKIIKYPLPDIEADIIIQSHEHYDHNAISRINGAPQIVKGTQKHDTEYELKIPASGETIKFNGLITYHDDSAGKTKGTNTVFLWCLDKINFCFLGDLGHLPDDKLIKRLGKIDVLFVPVGGLTTLNSTDASILINQLSPLAVFPMHYNTPAIDHLRLANESLQNFLDKTDSKKVLDTDEIAFDAITLPVKTTVIALKPFEG